MPTFRDHEGNFYEIPHEELQKYRVKGELPEGKRLGGGEIPGVAYNYTHPAAYNYVPPGGALYNWVPDTLPQGIAPEAAARSYNYAHPGAAAYNYAHPGAAAYNYVPPGGAVYNYAPTENTRAVALAAHPSAHNYPAGAPGGPALYFWDTPASGTPDATSAKEGPSSSGG